MLQPGNNSFQIKEESKVEESVDYSLPIQEE
jgi:hypothetical protein